MLSSYWWNRNRTRCLVDLYDNIVLGMYWTCTGKALELYRTCAGFVVELYRSCTGALRRGNTDIVPGLYCIRAGSVLQLYWCSHVIVLGLSWDSTGTAGAALEQYWRCTGTALALCWDCTVTVMALCWRCADTVLSLHWVCVVNVQRRLGIVPALA